MGNEKIKIGILEYGKVPSMLSIKTNEEIIKEML